MDDYISSSLYLSLVKVKDLLINGDNKEAFDKLNTIIQKLDEYESYKDEKRSK